MHKLAVAEGNVNTETSHLFSLRDQNIKEILYNYSPTNEIISFKQLTTGATYDTKTMSLH